MRIALLGATGTTGSRILAAALEQGHEVRVLVRDQARLGIAAHDRLRVIVGDARDPEALEPAVAGADAVLSALGGTSRTMPDVLAAGTSGAISAMRRARVRRLVVVQGFHLVLAGEKVRLGQRIVTTFIKLANPSLLADSRAMASVLESSGVDWTLVRAPWITPRPATRQYRTGALPIGPWNSVAAGDVADFVLRCAVDGIAVGAAPNIVSSRTVSPRPKEETAAAMSSARSLQGTGRGSRR